MLPRSGLAREHGIALVNSPGLIDAGYRGEIRVLLLNTDPAETFRVAAGDRIAQLVIAPIALAEPVEVAALAESARGDGRLRLQRALIILDAGGGTGAGVGGGLEASSSGSSSGRVP